MSPAGKNLYVYDKAVTDFLWAKQKDHQNYMISVPKRKFSWIESIAFDDSNCQHEDYSRYENQGVDLTSITVTPKHKTALAL